jgi:Transposase, Mutator family
MSTRKGCHYYIRPECESLFAHSLATARVDPTINRGPTTLWWVKRASWQGLPLSGLPTRQKCELHPIIWVRACSTSAAFLNCIFAGKALSSVWSILMSFLYTFRLDLKTIYSASTEEEAEFNLELFAEKWDALYPSISKSWRAHWTRVIPLFAFPEDIRKVIYTTKAIESVNMTLHKVTRNHRIFPSDEAVYKVVYLAMRNIAKKWTIPIHDWKPSLNRLAVEFAERFPR